MGAKVPIKINGCKTSIWIDSASPISIFPIGEIRKTLHATCIKLQEIEPKDLEFRDYGNNPKHLLGTKLISNGWAKSTTTMVIGGTQQSDTKRHLMAGLRLQSDVNPG